MRDLLRWLYDKATEWLTREGPPSPTPLCDFGRLGFELRTGDVILVEGRDPQLLRQDEAVSRGGSEDGVDLV